MIILLILNKSCKSCLDFLRFLRANCISTNLTTRIQINAAANPAITSVVCARRDKSAKSRSTETSSSHDPHDHAYAFRLDPRREDCRERAEETALVSECPLGKLYVSGGERLKNGIGRGRLNASLSVIFKSDAPIIVIAKSFASRPHFRIAKRTTTKIVPTVSAIVEPINEKPAHDRCHCWRSKLVDGRSCRVVKLSRVTFERLRPRANRRRSARESPLPDQATAID